jgi:hypothetical protein
MAATPRLHSLGNLERKKSKNLPFHFVPPTKHVGKGDKVYQGNGSQFLRASG